MRPISPRNLLVLSLVLAVAAACVAWAALPPAQVMCFSAKVR
jgi:hypothetical protein